VDRGAECANAAPDPKFAAVAEFGMFVRDSEYKGTGSLGAVAEWAEKARVPAKTVIAPASFGAQAAGAEQRLIAIREAQSALCRSVYYGSGGNGHERADYRRQTIFPVVKGDGDYAD
jgi:hypothetical protein